MILDAQNLFSNAQSVAITGAVASTDLIDLSQVRDIGTGQRLLIFVSVDTTFVGAGGSIAVALEGDSTTTFTPDGTQTLFTIPALTAAGSVFYAELDPAAAPLQFQFIQLRYTPGATLSAGAVTAGIIVDPQRVVNFADNITIS